jgi:iron-sulfur cluster assembly accessory protein
MSEANNAEFTGTDEQPIFLTPAAIEAARNAVKQEGKDGDGIRISVVGGGCSGYQYNLDFDHDERIGDTILELDGLKVYVDSVSAGYLKGTVVDYLSGLNGAGFKFNNPNARRTCGCGNSFG